mgnify:FL=1
MKATARRLPRPAGGRTPRAVNTGYSNYGANVQKKSMRGWMYYGGDAKRDIEDNINTLRQRSRDAYMGVPTATAALKTLRTNVVAAGLKPTPQLDGEFLHLSVEQVARLQAQLVREWNLWAKSTQCDADGMDNFYQLQQLAFLSAQMNGDAFALLQTETEPGMPYTLRVRLVEADRVCSPNGQDITTPTKVQGYDVYRIVQGVETDERGKVVAYWICDRHPLAADMMNGTQTWTRVEARGKRTGRRNILHIMQRERAGQVRGVPVLAPVLESLKQLGRYSDAELNAAVITAAYTIFIEKEAAGEAPPLGQMLPDDQLIDAQDPTSIELAPGAVVDLAPGEKMNETKPSRPNANFEAFYRAVTKEISEALEIPIEVLEKCFSTSYSAARGALNEFWRTCEMQREWFAEKFCQPIYETWLDEAVALGRVKAMGYYADAATAQAFAACKWNGPARTNLNPIQEVTAAEKRIALGISTAEQETAQMTGGNYTANIRQRKIEAQQKEEVDEIGREKSNPPPAGE